ncbi:hypothetical protein CPB85DRAFT_124723 [Mucidula mucida]|nr:hypothetical protein CPB85DRAFT_124723 [Mucidula mucida]
MSRSCTFFCIVSFFADQSQKCDRTVIQQETNCIRLCLSCRYSTYIRLAEYPDLLLMSSETPQARLWKYLVALHPRAAEYVKVTFVTEPLALKAAIAEVHPILGVFPASLTVITLKAAKNIYDEERMEPTLKTDLNAGAKSKNVLSRWGGQRKAFQ